MLDDQIVAAVFALHPHHLIRRVGVREKQLMDGPFVIEAAIART